MAVLGRGGQVGAHRGVVLGAGEGAHAPGDLLLDFDDADVALGRIVVEGHPRVGGEPQVVLQASVDAAGPGAGAGGARARRAGAGWGRPTAPGGPVSAEAPIRAAETTSRRWAARTSGSGRTPVSVTAFKPSSASMIWPAQHQPAGVSAPAGGWTVWESTTAMSSRNRWALHKACVAAE